MDLQITEKGTEKVDLQMSMLVHKGTEGTQIKTVDRRPDALKSDTNEDASCARFEGTQDSTDCTGHASTIPNLPDCAKYLAS